jgi:V8-like Glu-specific endopeptidase
VDRDWGAPAPSPEELRDLLDRATTAFGSGTQAALEAEIAAQNRRAIAFLNLDPMQARAQGLVVDAAAASAAIAALRRGDMPPREQMDALELCIRFMRPAWLFRQGHLVVEGTAPCSPDGRAHIEAAGRFTLAVTLSGINQRDAPIGSGFLVAPDRMITNDHVRRDILNRWGRADEQGLADGLALARFGLEDGSTDRWSVAIVGVIARHPTEDVVVLRLAPEPRLAAGPLPSLAQASAGAALGAEIAVIGHPMPDARNPVFGAAVLGTGGAPGVRRASPGRVIRGGATQFSHDCSTLGGSSGSPVIDRRTGVVIGVHASGVFAVRNGAISTAALFGDPALRDGIGRQRFV